MAAKKNSTSKSSKKSKKSGLGAGLWLLFALLLVIIFLVKKDEIFTNLKDTRFFDKLFGSTPELIETHESKKKKPEIPEQKDDVITIQVEEKHTPVIEVSEPAKKEETVSEKPVVEKAPAVAEKTAKTTEEKKTAAPQKEEKIEQPKPVPKTEVELCFVVIDSDGSVNRKIVKRSVNKNDSPLVTSINLVLAGPVTSNGPEKNCETLIPDGTKLLSAKISNGVAYLNFNDKFEFNSKGADGYRGQLMQIVYTATYYPTVNSVRFLIEGEERDYLGSEGQWIGSPLSRSSF